VLRQLPVLVVEHNATSRAILTDMLKELRLRPTAVDNGSAALAELTRAEHARTPFRLLIVDAQMPDGDGFALAIAARREAAYAGPLIVLSTSDAQETTAARCPEVAPATHLLKPVVQSELREALVHLLAAGPCAPGARPAHDGSSHAGGHSRLHVLLAEDNVVNQRLAVSLLERRGHTVVLAGNGREALEAFETDRFDVVLMDVQMPEMDGFEATAAIRARENGTARRVPILAMTAHAMKGDREMCLRAGMDGYVPKPIRVAELFAAIAHVTAGADGAVEAVTEDLPSNGASIDHAALLDRLDGNTELVSEIARLFLDQCPQLLSNIRGAITRGDRQALRRAAHSLKGSVGVFGPTEAYQTVQEIEELSDGGDLAASAAACRMLERAIEGLTPALAALV
jgi:CheY-like chemotaxis protein